MSHIQQFQKITPEKAIEQFKTLVLIDSAARIVQMASLSLDMRFKKPLIGNHIKRIKDSAAFIKADLTNDPKYGFKAKDEDYAFDATGELYELMALAINFGKEGIAELNTYLREQYERLSNPAETTENV